MSAWGRRLGKGLFWLFVLLVVFAIAGIPIGFGIVLQIRPDEAEPAFPRELFGAALGLAIGTLPLAYQSFPSSYAAKTRRAVSRWAVPVISTVLAIGIVLAVFCAACLLLFILISQFGSPPERRMTAGSSPLLDELTFVNAWLALIALVTGWLRAVLERARWLEHPKTLVRVRGHSAKYIGFWLLVLAMVLLGLAAESILGVAVNSLPLASALIGLVTISAIKISFDADRDYRLGKAEQQDEQKTHELLLGRVPEKVDHESQ